MKSGSTIHRPNPPAVEKSPGKKFKRVNVKQNGGTDAREGLNPPAVEKSPAKKFKRVNVKQNGGTDAREGLVGPEANVSGPFPPGQRSLQCHKCKGWGHVKRVCPSCLNYTRGGMPGNGTLLPQSQSLWKHRLQLQKGPNNSKSSEDG